MESHGSRTARKGLVKVNEAVVVCPACNTRSLRIADYLYEIPMVGPALLSVGRCEKCGYRYSDVRVLEARGPRRLVLRVEEPSDLNSLVVRSSTASIVIPEKGLEMRPGPAAQGFMTTVEGVLERFLEAAELACKSGEADESKCREIIEWLRRAKEGRERFTLVLEDPEGVSAIASKKVKVEELE